MSKNRSLGFTLIELLVVIAIIGILSAVVLASLGTARSRARDASAQSSISSLRAQNEIFYSTGNTYGTAGVGTMPTTGGAGTGLSGACNDAAALPLLRSAAAQAGNTVTCVVGASGTSWVAYVTLSSQTAPANYCADSSGFSGSLTVAPAAAAAASNPAKCQ